MCVLPVIDGLDHRQQRGARHQSLLYQHAAELVGFFEGAFGGKDNPGLRVRFEHFVLPASSVRSDATAAIINFVP